MSRTEVQRPDTRDAETIGTTHRAQRSMAAFLDLLTGQPRLIRPEDSQPPPTLPTVVMV
jgi:hypothetical protein